MLKHDYRERLCIAFSGVKQELGDHPPSGVLQRVEDLEGLLNDEFETLHRKIEELGCIVNDALETVWQKEKTDIAPNDEQSLAPIPMSLSLS